MAERLTKKQRREQTQAKVAAMRAAQARKERQRRILVSVGAVVSVLVIVAAFVIIKVSIGDDNKPSAAVSTGAASDTVVNGVGGVPVSTYDTVGAGTVDALPKALTGAPALTADGKPRVLYVGAEFCPYCAGERWAVAAALSRFGSFSGLGVTSSSSSDVYPDTQTLTFHGSTYTSSVLSFTAYETTDRDRKPLDSVTAADEALVAKYDSPAGSIPFVDIGGKWTINGASYDVAVLKGKTHEEIATAMGDPTTAIAKAIDGTANVITAALCTLTKDAPASVCSSAGVKAADAKLLNAH